MKTCGERAEEYFYKGYNCCQSVVAPFAERLGLTEEAALRMACGLGGGVGRLREVCGAVCGMAFITGTYYADPTDPEDKSRIYGMVQQLAGEFRQRSGMDSYICRELLNGSGATTGPNAEARTPEYYQRRPCPRLVRTAAELMEAFLESHPREEPKC